KRIGRDTDCLTNGRKRLAKGRKPAVAGTGQLGYNTGPPSNKVSVVMAQGKRTGRATRPAPATQRAKSAGARATAATRATKKASSTAAVRKAAKPAAKKASTRPA